MQIRSPRTALALSVALALTAAALAPTAAFAKGGGGGAADCDGDCTADQPQVQARDGSNGGNQLRTRAQDGSAQETETQANAGGGQAVQARAGNGGNDSKANGRGRNVTAETRGRNANQAAESQGQGQNAKEGAGKGPNEDGERGPGTCDDCDVEMGTLTDAQADGLVFMAYEEKLAHDVYAALAEQYGVRVFDNIADAEARHQVAVRTVLERYGIEDPTAELAAGEFTGNDLISSLYDTLMADGAASLEEAIAVGALIEETDIADLQERMADLETAAAEEFAADVHEMYSHLLAGSENHLAAFQGWM